LLVSSLMREDPNLQACLVNDSAHLTIGAQGRHVARVQMALFALDWLVIDKSEIRSQSYGSSTAAAVLSFKRKRGIINFSYQQTADNIVGKMTIARLDSEMVLWERGSRRLDICSCCPPGDPASENRSDSRFFASSVAASAPASGTGAGTPPTQFNKTLHIICTMTRKTQKEGGFNFQPLIDFANVRLKTFGMQIAVDFSSANSPAVIEFFDSLVLDDDLPVLRKACEDVHSGSPGVLRAIACHRSVNANPGQTYRDIFIGGTLFKPFIVLNSNLTTSTTPLDDNVLIHEMIHASHAKIEPHDPELTSVFTEFARTQSTSPPRTILKDNRALQLSSGFFAA
jgi:hypothetical protein